MAYTLFINKFTTNITEGINYIHIYNKYFHSSALQTSNPKKEHPLYHQYSFYQSVVTPTMSSLSEIRMSLSLGA
jgi:hypothetical protein